MNEERSCLLGGLSILLGLGAVGCVSAPRFKDQPIVWRVDDRHDTPPLEEREFLVHQYAADIFALRRLTRAAEVHGRTPARDTNALDEVPDSTWFTNRIGVRTVSPDDAAKGPDVSGPPRLPLVVIKAKRGGTNPGFVAKDATGRKFVIKFDPVGTFELQTAASVTVNRFFWTIGYSVPSDHVFDFSRADVTVDPKATVGRDDAPFSAQLLDDILATAPRLPNGGFRASSSEFIAGVPVGGFAAEGVRTEDPNDRIPHEHRRVLRGLFVFAAWLDHTDMKEDNGLDVYVREGNRHYLRHYLIDFGEALGGHGAEKGRMEDGFEHAWDWENQTKAAFSFGLWKRPWESRTPSKWPSVGSLVTTDFDPRGWHEAYPYWPFFERDAADEYWAAKIVMRFDRRHVEALVAAGQLSEPAAAAHLVDAIMIRREKIGRAYIEAVTSLDDFRLERGRLCGVDLGTRFGLAHGGLVERLDAAGKVLETVLITADGTVCLAPLSSGYVALRLRTRRGTEAITESVKPPMQVHVKDAVRVVGILRVEP